MITQDLNKTYKTNIIALYHQIYDAGVLAQNTVEAELSKLVDLAYDFGKVYVNFENEELISVLLAYPLQNDNLFPIKDDSSHFMDSIYISELMVNENHRKRGLGKELMFEFEKRISAVGIKKIYIRVWDENLPALKLYRSMGYEELCQIKQSKLTFDREDTIEMNKIYLLKRLV